MWISRRWPRAVEMMGVNRYGPIDQSQFLRRLGIETRAAALKAKATPHAAAEIDLTLARLIGHGPQRHGRPVQGCRFHPSEPGHAARIRVNANPCCKPLHLSKLAGIRHAFFTRAGGVSQGVYATLNGGVGSNDAPDKVNENRARMAAALGVTPDHLLSAYQIHSPDVVVADKPWPRENRPRADAIVTRTPRLALRRIHRRLRTAVVCRCAVRRHRRGACRLARRL